MTTQNAETVALPDPLTQLRSAADLLAQDGHPAHAAAVLAYVENVIQATRLLATGFNPRAQNDRTKPDPREGRTVVDEVGEPHPFDAQFCGPGCKPTPNDSSEATT